MARFHADHDTRSIRLVTVADNIEAAAILQKLHEHGIESYAASSPSFTQEITLFVPMVDLRRARELIGSGDDHPDTVEQTEWEFSRCNDAPNWNGPKSSPLR
ncbi:MAG: hypothetical protein U0903_01325 [Planctomycetales bacterium]